MTTKKRFHLLLDLRLDWMKPNPRVLTLSSLALRLEALTTRIHREGKQKINTLACAC
jgi:hypothetical protein